MQNFSAPVGHSAAHDTPSKTFGINAKPAFTLAVGPYEAVLATQIARDSQLIYAEGRP